MPTKPNWPLVSYIKSSKYRERVLKALGKPQTPTDIKKELKIDKAHVTRALQSLVKEKLVICHTPNVRKYKIFERSQEGEKILQDL